MKIAHCGDLHLTSRPSRSDCSLEEQRAILGWIAQDIIEQPCDAVLIGGDVFDRKDTTAEERELAYWFLQRVPPYVMVSGNHDNGKDLQLVHTAGLATYQSLYLDRAEVVTFCGLMVGCLPWPRRNPDMTAEGTKAALRTVLDSIKAQFAETDKPKILVGHLDTLTAKFDGGQDNTGKVDISIDPRDLADLGADYVALAHYHRRQSFDGLEWSGPIWYCGSIRQQRFGDDPAKGYLIYDTETREVTERNAPSRKLWSVNMLWDRDSSMSAAKLDPIVRARLGDVVRIRYDAPEGKRDELYKMADNFGRRFYGMAQVIIEPRVIASSAVRSGEIVTAKTPAEKLEAYWGATKRPERGVEIAKKLAEVLP